MGGKLKRQWEEFKRGQPGRRFQDRYERNQQKRQNKRWHAGLLKLCLGLLFIALGVVLMVMPGPAILFFALGGGMLADYSRTVARMLDWLELKIRRVLHWTKHWWKHASIPARSRVVGLLVLSMTAAGYFLYRVWT